MLNKLKSDPKFAASQERIFQVHIQHLNAGIEGLCEIYDINPVGFKQFVADNDYNIRLAYLTLGEMLGMVEKPPVHEKKHWWVWK